VVGEHVENPLVALLGLGEVFPILVQQPEVDQAADVSRETLDRPLVAVDRFVVVAVAVVEQAEVKEGGWLGRIEGQRPLEGGDHVFVGRFFVGQMSGLLGPVGGRLLGLGLGQRCELLAGLISLAGLAQGFRRQ